MATAKKKKSDAKKKTKKKTAKRKKPASEKKKSAVAKKSAKKKKTAKKKPAAKKKTVRRKCALITGAAGYVGGHMVEEFVSAGYKVIANDIPGANLDVARAAGAEIVEADFTDATSLGAMFKGKVHYVIHVGALYDLGARRRDLMRVNRDGTRNLAEAAVDAGVERFVYFSTGDIHGQVDHIITEDTPPAPLNAYAESKWKGERVVRRLHKTQGLPIIVIRPTVIYGPRGRYAASNFFCIPGIVHVITNRLNLQQYRELTVFSDGPLFNWVHVRDITGAVRFLVGKPEAVGNAYNVSDDDPMTLGEFLGVVFEMFDYEWQPTFQYPTKFVAAFARLGMRMPTFMFDLMTKFMQAHWGEVRDMYGLTDDINPRFSRDFMTFMLGDRIYDNSQLKGLGYELRYPDSREGFRETFEWYREHRWLPKIDEVQASKES